MVTNLVKHYRMNVPSKYIYYYSTSLITKRKANHKAYTMREKPY